MIREGFVLQNRYFPSETLVPVNAERALLPIENALLHVLSNVAVAVVQGDDLLVGTVNARRSRARHYDPAADIATPRCCCPRRESRAKVQRRCRDHRSNLLVCGNEAAHLLGQHIVAAERVLPIKGHGVYLPEEHLQLLHVAQNDAQPLADLEHVAHALAVLLADLSELLRQSAQIVEVLDGQIYDLVFEYRILLEPLARSVSPLGYDVGDSSLLRRSLESPLRRRRGGGGGGESVVAAAVVVFGFRIRPSTRKVALERVVVSGDHFFVQTMSNRFQRVSVQGGGCLDLSNQHLERVRVFRGLQIQRHDSCR